MRVNTERLRIVPKEEVDSIELKHGEFTESENRARAYRLNNNDVFTIYSGEAFQFYDDILYEVEFDGYEYEVEGVGVNPKWKRTGVSCKVEDFNDKYIYKENN